MQDYITYKGKKIYFLEKGNGHTIVLLHGFLENMSMWEYISQKLSASYRVIAIDLPGFGNSDCLAEVHEMETLAEVVNEVLIIRRVKDCLMLGHSMGGYVTLAFAEKYPDKLKGFGLLHSHALADTDEAKVNRDRAIVVVNSNRGAFIFNFFPALFAPDNIDKHEQDIEKLHADAMKTSPKAIVAALKGMKDRTDKKHVLMNSKIPVLFILGKNDSRIPFEKTLEQTLLPEHCDLIILDNAGHMGHIEAKKKVLNAIENFAKKIF